MAFLLGDILSFGAVLAIQGLVVIGAVHIWNRMKRRPVTATRIG
ncbi:hypothetical protein BQ8794_60096 [Mesorhizobium prunaredense]|uniref:Uncharacterized protein n=1 Tax=Mesorhizobium prunaredense TaxID=1631249 RepID=A0A1R3VHN5_9HYPH|nr:hypothetical protein BQ8794_60096 [Mesorhizobium prunaredense]